MFFSDKSVNTGTTTFLEIKEKVNATTQPPAILFHSMREKAQYAGIKTFLDDNNEIDDIPPTTTLDTLTNIETNEGSGDGNAIIYEGSGEFEEGSGYGSTTFSPTF